MKKILTGKPRILLENIRRTGAGQLVLIRFGKDRSWEKRHGLSLVKKGFIDPMENGPERGSYFCRWTGKDPDHIEKPAPVPIVEKDIIASRIAGSKDFPPKIRRKYPNAWRYRVYKSGTKTIEIPIK